MRKIRIGHIGTLHDHSEGKLQSLQALSDIFEVVGIVYENDAQYEKLKHLKAYAEVPRMSEEQLFEKGVDAVIVEGDELELVNIAKRCIERGVHVHMDKPAGIDIDKFEELLSLAKARGLTLQLAYMYRYNPEVLKARELIKEGKLGDIYSIEAGMSCEHTKEKRQWLSKFPGGMMFFLGCHLIDLIVLLQGVPNEVIPLNAKTGIDGVDAEDFGMAVLKYDNGASVAKTCAAEVCGFSRRHFVICGSKGTVELKPFEVVDVNYDIYSISRTALKKEKIEWTGVGEMRRSDNFGRYDAMMSDFAKMVRGEAENPYSYDYELMVHRVILAACGLNVDYKK